MSHISLDQEFIDDCPYGPEALFIDKILVVDPEKSLVRVQMQPHEELPLTRHQRVHPLKHPRHVAGGLMIHMTGVVGMVHAYYVMGLRHREGWTGYGARIHSARFHNIARMDAPLELEGQATQLHRGNIRVLVRYALRFYQNGGLVYEGDQTALWTKIAEAQTTEQSVTE